MTRVDGTVEKRIITSMIVSDRCLSEISQIYKPEYFINSFARTVAEWAISYHSIYKKSPLATIKDIYENEKDYLSDDDAKVISDLLSDISDKYSASTSYNTQYAIDQAFEYFERRETEQAIKNAQTLLEKGDTKKAKLVLAEHNKVMRVTSKWCNPFAEEEIQKYWEQRSDTSEFFKMGGYLGEYMGNMKPTWLIGITAPFKRGKSNLLIEIAANAIMQEKPVVIFSLEMAEQEMKDRIYRRMLNVIEPHDPIIQRMDDDYAEFNIPVLDCFKNQMDSCTLPCRVGRGKIRLQDGTLPEYAVNLKYKTCTACMKEKKTEYIAAHWWKQIKAPTLDAGITRDKLNNIAKYYKHFCRIKKYPQYSAGIIEFRRDLEILNSTEGFLAQIILTDYAEICRASNPKAVGIEKEDLVWMEAAQLASEFNALSFLPTQGNKDSLEAEHVKQQHTSRWIGKLGHVTGMYCLNQMDSEKKEHIMRIACMLHRFKPFEMSQEAYLLQNIAAGQFHLNSAPIKFKQVGKRMEQDLGQ